MQGKEWLSVGGGCRGKDWPERRRRIRRALFEKSVNRRESQGEERRGRDLGFFRWTFRTPSGIEIHILN